MRLEYLFLTIIALVYILISGRLFETLVIGASFCFGGWASCYYSWRKLNRGIERGTYEAPIGEDGAIIVSSILLPLLFSVYISAVYVFVLDITALVEVSIQISTSLLAIIGFTSGLLIFFYLFWGGITKANDDL